MDDEFNIQLLKAESILQYSLFVLRSSSKRYVFLAPNLETEIQMQTDFQIFGYFLFLCVFPAFCEAPCRLSLLSPLCIYSVTRSCVRSTVLHNIGRALWWLVEESIQSTFANQ